MKIYVNVNQISTEFLLVLLSTHESGLVADKTKNIKIKINKIRTVQLLVLVQEQGKNLLLKVT